MPRRPEPLTPRLLWELAGQRPWADDPDHAEWVERLEGRLIAHEQPEGDQL